jgi:cytochrome c oxidase subunit 3
MTEGKSGLIAGVAAITMLFAAFLSAYLVRRGISTDWVPLELPLMMYASLLPLVGTSALVGLARRRSALLGAGAILGTLVCAMQVYACRQLNLVGPAASFYLVISAAFLVFLIGGVVGLLYSTFRRSGAVTSHFYYWVYLSALWTSLLAYLTFCN